MRIDFNVLWVDDQPSAIDSQIERITSAMAEEGFRFRPTKCKSLDEVESIIDDSVFQDEVDLIIVDWDLGEGVFGQDVIARVRQVAQYKDVVFYSAHTPAAELRSYAHEAGLEGIYCASRADLVDEVFGVFESLVKKVLDLDHTRGIVMGATSDIDHLVRTCLAVAHSKLDEKGKLKFITAAVERVNAKVKDTTKRAEKIAKQPTIDALFKAHMLFTADDRLRLLAEILEQAEFASHAHAQNTITAYRDEVVPDRNMLGHMVLVPDGKARKVVLTEEKQVNLDEMRALRKRILGLREDFRELAAAMTK